MCSDGDNVTCAGSPFQTRAAETGKARSPTVKRRVGGTTSVSDDDERSIYNPMTRWTSRLTASTTAKPI